jgi:hypothetical protein
MIQRLKILWFKIFPIDREKAIQIAAKSPAPDTRQYQAYENPPYNLYVYLPSKDPCWYVTAPWRDGLDGQMLRSSRIILVSKKTGKVLFDGPANDEG